MASEAENRKHNLQNIENRNTFKNKQKQVQCCFCCFVIKFTGFVNELLENMIFALDRFRTIGPR